MNKSLNYTSTFTKQVNNFAYLGRENGRSREKKRMAQARATACKRVEGNMWDRKLKKQINGKELETYVVQ